MKKRILCLLVTAALCVAALPLSVFAYTHSDSTPLPEGVYKTWKQKDARWSEVILGVDPWTDSSGVYHEHETVGHAGCLVTSMAILARAYGLTLADGTTVDPGTLATAMYDGGSLKYLNSAGAARYDTAFDALIPGVKFFQFQRPANPVSAVSSLLSDSGKEYAIIIGVNSGAHYVAADYVQNGEVYICDPGSTVRTKLSDYTFYCLLVFEIDEAYVDGGTVIPGQNVWTVTETAGVRIRSGAGTSYERLGVYPCGTKIEVYETAEADGYLWGRTADGWCALRMLDFSEIYCVLEDPELYSVTYHMNGGEGGPETQYKTAGVPLKLAEDVPVKEGYRFLGWSEDPSAISADYVSGGEYRDDAALVLYAVWMAESDIFAYGIDVSSYQGDVDWETVAASGIEFVILRAGTSRGKDKKFEENYLAAKAAGLHIGSYFFSYALTPAEARADAALFTQWLAGKEFDMPVFLDVETEAQSALPAGELNTLAIAFLADVEKAGYYCGVYSSATWYDSYLDSALLGGKKHLWVAKWTKSGTLSQNMSEQYAMYQYSETGTVPGIGCTVDLNVCYVDFPTLIAEQGQGGDEPPIVVPTPADPAPKADSGLEIAGDYLLGGKEKMTAAEWKALFDGDVQFADSNGTVLDDGALVGSGCTVLCGKARYTVVLLGDTSCDGEVSVVDYMLIRLHVLGKYELEGAALQAAFLAGGDTVGLQDYMLLRLYLLGGYSLYE